MTEDLHRMRISNWKDKAGDRQAWGNILRKAAWWCIHFGNDKNHNTNLLIRTVVPRFTPTKRQCKNSWAGDDHDGDDNNSDNNNNNNNINDMSVWYWPLLTLATEDVCACLDRSGFQHLLQLNKTSWMQIPRYLSPFMVYPTSRTCRTTTHPQRVLASNTRLSTSRYPLLMRGLLARRPAGFWGVGFCFASASPECSYDVNWQCVQHKFIHFPTVT